LPPPAVRRAQPVPDKNGYCITTVARKAAHFRPGTSVEIEPEAHFRAIDTKVAFTIAILLLGIGQGHGHGSGGADIVIL
jgi:hypothetical protein